ncbi:MAG: protein tyrosine phosphatase family protein [Burkholderiales bacterium]|nr:protein tyrosine phosphatase family protein [Burkholderiales bacterium]
MVRIFSMRIFAALLLWVATTGHAQLRNVEGIDNYIEITPKLSVSGQPTAAQLERFKALGIEAVVYIAPPQVGTSVREEPLLLGRQGLLDANIPVNFGNPTQADFDAFAAVLSAWKDKRVHVHCQVNMRGSVFMFLYRVIHDKVPAEQAYEIVRRIWVPDPVWRKFLVDTLRQRGIAFDPL